ncbi:MAG: hypothetical protein JWO58_23 [Chitinophagaceae bacterium]|nr:hypothetical protein [Chitinophagaceae bacterium]
MKKEVKYYFGIVCCLLLLFVMSTCKPHKIDDVGSQNVTILTPQSGSLQGYTQTFAWSKVDGAVSYQLIIQAVSADTALVDTIVINNSNTFVYTLDPGDYEWKINARNGISHTAFTSSTFTILVQPLEISTVLLTLPVNQGYSKDSITHLYWHHLYGETGYEIQVNTANSFTGSLYKDTTSTTTDCKIPLKNQGFYYWRVRAYNSTDTSLWSTVYSFTYDTIPPALVVQTKPLNNTTDLNTTTGNLEWQSLGADAASYNIYIKYGSTSSENKVSSSVDSYPYVGLSSDTVFWRVEAVDPSGNVGPQSSEWEFVIQ